jgi:hypothetical protein
VADFAVNNSDKTGKVYFGEEVKVVGPRGKIEISTMPSFWTKNIQLVKGITRSRADKKSGAVVHDVGQSSGGGSNG